MTIESLETVYLTCIFVIPGFIIDNIINLFYPPPKRTEAIHFLYFLLYSVFHIVVFGWAYLLLFTIKEINYSWYIAGLFGVAVVGAVILGIIIGLFKSKELLRKLLNKCSCNTKSAIPTAWDFFFSHQGALYVIVTLTDDSKVYGLYGENSFTSSNPDERDIYIEKIYDIGKNNEWIDNPLSLGIHINHNQIKSIEFLKGEEKNGEQQ